ncbi:MAG: HPr family phosphocarrier protein [Candidatus Omnitrophota bacterium]
MPKIEKKLIIRSRQGLHARPAAVFVQIANKYSSVISVRKGQDEVNGKSIMGMLMLGADCGSEVEMMVEGVDAEAMFAELEAYLAKED